MALSTGKRIASGVCFGRKISSTKPRQTNHGDRCFQNCNRLGCSIRQLLSKGSEVSHEESLHSSQTKLHSSPFQRSKEQKRVVSFPHNSNGIVDIQTSARNKLKRSPPVKHIHKNGDHGYPGSNADASPNKASGASCRPSCKRNKQTILCAKHGNGGNHGSLSQQTSPSSRTSEANKANVQRQRSTKLSWSSPSIYSSNSSPLKSDKNKKIASSTNRGYSFGASSSRSKAITTSPSSVKNASMKSRITSSSSTSHTRSLRSIPHVGLSCTTSVSYNHGEDPWDLAEVELSTAYQGIEAERQSLNVEMVHTSSYNYNPPSPVPWETGLSLEHGTVLESSLLDQQGIHDQLRDMRMDIDNMTYEELLALGEKIGTVSTALTEETLSKCIEKSIYQPLHDIKEVIDRDDDDVKCSICQDDYVGGDEVGKLWCNHRYHMDCIHQWFQLKNWCPVCKSSASSL